MTGPDYSDRDYGDVVDGARERHLMCHAGSVYDPASSPDGAKRNPGSTHTGNQDPDFASLHPGYVYLSASSP
jgi:hypothetical protein